MGYILMTYSPLFRGKNSAGTALGSASGYQNSSGSAIQIGAAVSINTSGQIVLTDVGNEASASGWVGLMAEVTPDGATGLAISDGRLQNIPLSMGFSVGDPIWVGNIPGTLTNIKPDLSGVNWFAGDFILFVGVVVKNEFNPTQQDIQLSRQIIGQV